MGKIKLLEKSLLDNLSRLLKKDGYKRKGQDYIRLFEKGKYIFHISFIEHPDKGDVDITGDVAIRFDEVEDMVNASNKMLSKKDKEQTSTIGAELGNILGEGQKRWTLSAEDDVSSISLVIYNEFSRTGKKYFDKYSSYKKAFEAIKQDDKGSWLHSPFHGPRALRAVALAILLDDEELVRETIANKEKFLREKDDFGLTQLKNLLSSIGRQVVGHQ